MSHYFTMGMEIAMGFSFIWLLSCLVIPIFLFIIQLCCFLFQGVYSIPKFLGAICRGMAYTWKDPVCIGRGICRLLFIIWLILRFFITLPLIYTVLPAGLFLTLILVILTKIMYVLAPTKKYKNFFRKTEDRLGDYFDKFLSFFSFN